MNDERGVQGPAGADGDHLLALLQCGLAAALPGRALRRPCEDRADGAHGSPDAAANRVERSGRVGRVGSVFRSAGRSLGRLCSNVALLDQVWLCEGPPVANSVQHVSAYFSNLGRQ